ncbi:MAG: hypothetical protein JNK82_05320 [Myxococcaceae bacterium]|nr:hypothetical protein [Myxococcaceae bacterium]
MSAWEQSEAARALRGAASLEVGAPPPLSAVREVARRRSVQAARLVALLVAIPIGATAAGGVYVWKRASAERHEPKPAKVQKAVLAPKLAEAKAAPAVVDNVVVAPPPAAPAKVVIARPRTSAPLTPTGERESTPEIPARGGGYAPPSSSAPARTSLADEATALTQALAALRTGHDPARALELLETYRTRFPGGALRHEAALATAEAHRALGHTGDALAALDEAPRRPDLDVLRAELNAELGHCEASRAIVRELKVSGALLERALFTDAPCALTLGARDEAIAALEQLPASPRARALLEKLK